MIKFELEVFTTQSITEPPTQVPGTTDPAKTNNTATDYSQRLPA